MKRHGRNRTITVIAVLSVLIVAGFAVALTIGSPDNLNAPTYEVAGSLDAPAQTTPQQNQNTIETRSAGDRLDPLLNSYAQVSGVSGNLSSIGSDTLNNILQLLAEDFRALYPNVNVQIQGAGSSTAPAALRDGTSQLGPMSRAMTGSEIDAFVATHGYEPTQVPVGIDAIGVFVHRDNPVEGLSLQQLDSIFSNSYRLGGEPISTWGQVGLEGAWSNRPISLYGRNSVSGTYGVFKSIALGGGDYHPQRYQEQPGSSTVIQSVSVDRYGIGYSGIGYLTAGVRAVPVGAQAGTYYEPTAENSVNLDYPLARLLYIYINKPPSEELPTLTREFLRFALSKEGQAAVVRDGFYPLPASVAATAGQSLGISW